VFDQVIGIGSVSLLVFLGVRLTQAFREGARMARSGKLAELERAVIRIPDLEEETTPAA
jgi:hypothetical protein